MTTCGTLARCVFRVYRDNGHAEKFRFVFDLLSQIGERPVIQSVSLAFTNRYPVADITQLFKSDGAASVFSLNHKLFGDNVVLEFLKAFLLARKLLEFSLRGFSLLSLEVASAVRKRLTDAFDILTGDSFAIGIGNDIDDTKINTKHIFRIKESSFINIANAIEKELSADVKESYFALSALKQFALFISHNERKGDSAIHCPNGNEVILLESDNPLVVGNRTKRAELPLSVGIDFVRVGNFRNRANNDLSRKSECISHSVIRQFMQLELLENLILKGRFRDVVTCLVYLLHCCKQSIRLHIQRGLQFEVDNQFHESIIPPTSSNIEFSL